MKHMKKLVTLLLALIMALALVIPAAAATVENKTGHAYEAYQIFKGTQSSDSYVLADVEWGSDIDSTQFLKALKTDGRLVDNANKQIFANCATAADVAEVLKTEADNSKVAKAVANLAAKHRKTTFTASIAKDAKNVELPAGYYLLVDVTTPGEGDAMNSALLQVTNKGNIVLDKKYDVPQVNKSVKDTDDQWGEAADWCIGSNVPFQLIGTLPSNYADYETYKYVFHDTLSSALKYNGDVTVYFRSGDKDTQIASSNFTVDPPSAATAGGGTLTITFNDLKKVSGVNITSGGQIVVKYTAKLLNTAVIGQPGNSNEVYLEYSSNPNFSGTGTPPTSETPIDTVLVFTYELDVNKVDGAETTKKLKDAEFKLQNADGKWATVDNTNKVTGWVDTQDKGSILKTDANGLAKIIGLDAGNYKLHETKAPAGYNKLKDPIDITITAELDKGENTPALKALTIKVGTGAAEKGDVAKGLVSTTVTNNSGATLPETGGVGTTLFYIIGGVLMVGAAVLLVTRKRMNNTK